MKSACMALLLSAIAGAQMQLPPGTTSAVPDGRSAASGAAQNTLQQAEEAIAAGRYEAAVALLKPLAVPAQTQARIFYDLAFAQDALGHDAEAVPAYRAALERNPQDGTAHASLGLLLARGGDRAGAEQQLQQAVKTAAVPPEVAGRALRALAQMHANSSPAQAADELAAALKLLPETTDDAILAAAIADAQHDDAAAARAYAHAQGMAPEDAENALGYARLLSRQGRHTEAEATLAAAQKAHPQNRALTAEYASQELLLGHTAAVLPLLQDLHNAAPDDVPMARLLATAYVAAGEPARAEPLYAALLKMVPHDAGVRVEWADCLIRQKRSAEAEPLLKRLVFEEGKSLPVDVLANAAGMLAFAASTNHDPETVLSALAVRAPLAPSGAPYTFLLATAHDTLHHTSQAADQYRRFLAEAAGKLPDQEWQAQQRLQILDRKK